MPMSKAEKAAAHLLQKLKDVAIESKKFIELIIEYRKIVSKVTITEGLSSTAKAKTAMPTTRPTMVRLAPSTCL